MQSPGMRRDAGVVLTATLSLLLLATLTTLRLTAAGLPASRRPAPAPAALHPTTHEISPTQQVWLPHIVGPSAARVLIGAAHLRNLANLGGGTARSDHQDQLSGCALSGIAGGHAKTPDQGGWRLRDDDRSQSGHRRTGGPPLRETAGASKLSAIPDRRHTCRRLSNR